MGSDPVLCPTGQLFRPSYVGWPRCLGNPDPQGTGSPRPSPAALPPETRNRKSPSYRAKAVEGVLGPGASGMGSDPQDENGVARRPFSRYPFGHRVQIVHGLAAADCLNSLKHHAYALWGWASPHSRVSTPRARCLLLPAMWVTCRSAWLFGMRSDYERASRRLRARPRVSLRGGRQAESHAGRQPSKEARGPGKDEGQERRGPNRGIEHSLM